MNTTGRIMGDSVTAKNIPRTVQVVGGYVNGSYAWTTAEWALFPAIRYGHALIDVDGTHAQAANVLDIETGDASPPDGPAWVEQYHAHHEAGVLPVLYCNRSNRPAVEQACTKAGLVLARDYGLWIATLDGTVVSGTGVVACQVTNHANLWDQSLVMDPHIWLPASPPPTAVPGPTKAQALAADKTITAYLAE